MRIRGVTATVAIVLLASVTATACGSDDKGSSANAGTTAAGANPSTTAAGSPTTVAAAKGEPIRLGLITRPEYMTLAPPGAKAAVARINAAGGVKGRPLELVTCSNENNGNTAAACAQKFAGDASIIATVGDNNSFGGDTNPPLEAVKVAGIGTAPLGAGDYASSRVFANNAGGLLFLGGARFLLDKGSQKIGMVTIDTPTAQALPDLISANVLAPRGAKLVGTAAIPATAADVSTQAASLVGADGQLLALTEDLSARYIRASRQQGFKGPMVFSQTTTRAKSLQDALSPADLEKVYAITYYRKSSDGYAKFLQDMTKYAADTTPGDLNASAWLSVQTFADTAGKLPTISRESVWGAMNSLSNYDTGGMTPLPLDYTKPGTVLGGKAPRLVPSVLSVYFDVIKDGKFVPAADQTNAVALFG